MAQCGGRLGYGLLMHLGRLPITELGPTFGRGGQCREEVNFGETGGRWKLAR